MVDKRFAFAQLRDRLVLRLERRFELPDARSVARELRFELPDARVLARGRGLELVDLRHLGVFRLDELTGQLFLFFRVFFGLIALLLDDDRVRTRGLEEAQALVQRLSSCWRSDGVDVLRARRARDRFVVVTHVLCVDVVVAVFAAALAPFYFVSVRRTIV